MENIGLLDILLKGVLPTIVSAATLFAMRYLHVQSEEKKNRAAGVLLSIIREAAYTAYGEEEQLRKMNADDNGNNTVDAEESANRATDRALEIVEKITGKSVNKEVVAAMIEAVCSERNFTAAQNAVKALTGSKTE